MGGQKIYENLCFDSATNKLTLTIKQGKLFVFEKVLDSAFEQWLNGGKTQDELDKFIKKQNDKYCINKPLVVRVENINDTESSEYDKASKQNDKKSNESKRKTLYIQDELSFKNCVFGGEVRFEYICFAPLNSKSYDDNKAQSKSTQPLRIDFQHCEFKDRVYFTNCEFNGNVFFNHAVFYKYADFHESIFGGVVSFYNAEFNSAPNFSTCVFQNLQATNFINVKIDSLDFGKIEEFINEYENDETYKKERAQSQDLQKTTNTHKIRYASNARDSFRTIKNVLIANNNLLDACAWHKLELYAKERELKLQKPCLLTAPKKWCDLWQLKLYRHTSAHHTDLLKIWHTLIVLNGVFGILFGLTLLFSHCQIDVIKCVDLCVNCCECQCKNLYEIYDNFCKVCINIILSLLFIVLFLCALVGKISRGLFVIIGYIASSVILIANPKYLFPAVSFFEKSESFSHIATISAIYTFFFILVIFSLQKTARKNSIIPN